MSHTVEIPSTVVPSGESGADAVGGSASGASGTSGPSGRVGPAATLPNSSGSVGLGDGVDGKAISKATSSAVYAVLTRSCVGNAFGLASAVAVDPRFLLTSRSALSERAGDARSPVDPAPWIRGSDGQWRRTRTVGISDVDGLALLQVESGYSELPSVLGWSTQAVSKGTVGVVVGYPGRIDGQERVLAVSLSPGDDASTVNFAIAASAESGRGLNGAPLVDESGHILGVNVDISEKLDSGTARSAGTAGAATAEMATKKAQVAGSCGADSSDRLALGWGVVLDPIGATSKATALSAMSGLSSLGRIGAVDQSWASFFPPRAPAPVILGPYGSEATARDALEDASRVMARADLAAPIGVGLFPVPAFSPATIPPAYTTMTMPPSTKKPPSTTARRTTTTRKRSTTTTSKTSSKSTTTTAKKATSTGACPPSGKRYLAVIANGGPGMSVIFRATPSPSGTGVAKAANGYRVSVVRGSSTNGFSQVVLPETPPRCPWVPNKYLG